MRKITSIMALVMACCLITGGIPVNAEELSSSVAEQNIPVDQADAYAVPETEEQEDNISANSTPELQDDILNTEEIMPQDVTGTDESAQSELSVVGTVDVINLDSDTGMFIVKVSGISGIETIHDVRIAVWSEEKGQDDLQWFVVPDEGKAEYYAEVNIADHKYSTGEYNIHAYVYTTSGDQIFLGSTSCDIQMEYSGLNITKENDKGEYTFNIDNLVFPGDEKEVLFAVWSEEGGQDDLEWYHADRYDNHAYRMNWSVKNHKALGKYNIDTYVKTTEGSMVSLGTNELTIDSPSVGSIEVKDVDTERGRFRVVLNNITYESMIKNIMIPVWSDENGQNDLIWYEAQKDNNGFYYADIDIKNHDYEIGNYSIHVYITDITGYQYFAGSTSCSLGMTAGSLDIQEVTASKIKVSLTGIHVPGGISQVMFPVWSEKNGQDDLIWYEARKVDDTTYMCEIDLRKHKGMGTYNIHAYVKNKKGVQSFVTSTSYVTKMPAVHTVTIEDLDCEAGRFRVRVSDIENEDLIDAILVPVWSEDNQSDLVWYEAKKSLFGNDYTVDVDIKNHKYNVAEYNVDCYIRDISGDMEGIVSKKCDMKPQIDSIDISDKNGEEKIFQIKVNRVQVPAGEKEVSVAVWGENNGQNDLIWYTMKKQGDGSYIAETEIDDHKETGTYQVHVYCKTKGGQMIMLGKTTFDVSATPMFAGVKTENIDGNKGTFRVTISGLMAPSGIKKVEVPMWCTQDQSDIVWYNASKLSEGVYTVAMDVKNHKYHFGDYNVHVYVTMGNGIRVGIKTLIQNISPVNYLYNEYVSDTQRRVLLLGTAAEKVQFPTWSDENGQDDIMWYDASNNGNNMWSAVIDSAKHKNGGNYTTHAYVTKNGIMTSVGATSYTLKKMPTEMQSMQIRANMYSSSTGFLLLVNRSTHKVGIFQGLQGNWNCIQYWDCSDGKASTPTVEGVFRVGSKGYYFDSGDSRCYWWTQFYNDYLFHSVLYNKYNGALMDGRLGMGLSHGCVRLDINNAKWIYDTIPSGSTVVVYH